MGTYIGKETIVGLLFSWSSIDGLEIGRPWHYQAKKAFGNVIISTSKNENELDVYIVNDTFLKLKIRLLLVI